MSELFDQHRRNRFKGQSLEDARGWLYGRAKNLIFEFHRSGQVERKTMEKLKFERVIIDEDEAIEPAITDSTAKKLIKSTLSEIRPEYREAITLRYLEEREYAEIARHLNVTEDVVRTRVSRGLKAMRQIAGSSPEWEKARSHG